MQMSVCTEIYHLQTSNQNQIIVRKTKHTQAKISEPGFAFIIQQNHMFIMYSH